MTDSKESNAKPLIQLVVCRYPEDFKAFLFKAPAEIEFKKDDEIIVDTYKGEQKVIVCDFVTVEQNSKIFYFIKRMYGAKELKKVKAIYTYQKINYEEDKNE